jgi:two-component system sensor histidine kinase YesM
MKRRIAYPSKLGIWILFLIIVAIVIPFGVLSLYLVKGYEQLIQRELSNNLIQIVSQSKADLDNLYNRMIYISNAFISNDSFRSEIEDETATYYEQTKAFDAMVESVITNDPSFSTDLKVTVVDKNNRIFANWSQNYNDYSFINSETYVKESKQAEKHIIWGGVLQSFIYEDAKSRQYITLARSIYSDSALSEYLCTFILSLDKDRFGAVVSRYFSDEKDFAFLKTHDDRVLFSMGYDGGSAEFPPDAVFENDETYYLTTIENTRYLVFSDQLENSWFISDNPLSIQFFINFQPIEEQLSTLVNGIRWGIIFSMVAVLLMVVYITFHVIRPISNLSKKIHDYSIDTIPVGLDVKRKDEIGQINTAFIQMAEKNKSLFYRLRHESLKKEQYYYESVRAQVNPHFLFNTLTTIRWMAIIKKADNIVDSIDALADILKYSMDKGKEFVTLEEEVHSIKSYVSLQNYHYGSRFVLLENISQDLFECQVIKFILQPIVENSILHAFKEKKSNCVISIRAICEERNAEKRLILSVSDNGIGMSKEQIEEFDISRKKGYRRKNKESGIGFLNVDERIRIQFGTDFGLSITAEPDKGTTVWYTLPLLPCSQKVEEEKDVYGQPNEKDFSS